MFHAVSPETALNCFKKTSTKTANQELNQSDYHDPFTRFVFVSNSIFHFSLSCLGQIMIST